MHRVLQISKAFTLQTKTLLKVKRLKKNIICIYLQGSFLGDEKY